jgi:2-dehydro-3-deoxygluconokinase
VPDSTAPRPFLLAVGDPLIALMPPEPISVEAADRLAVFVGGAEINVAIGVRRLGIEAGWLGRVGADPFGRRVVSVLEREGVETSMVLVDPRAPTGLYVREWLPDGARRPYYYRYNAAGAQLSACDWPQPWPSKLQAPRILHVTGITVALSPSAEEALHEIIDRAVALGATISVDPNYRSALWPDVPRARAALTRLAHRANLLLLSEEDAHVLFETDDPAAVFSAASDRGVSDLVFKRGARGAIVRYRGQTHEVAPEIAAREVDPVGAGDAFNAGFLAAIMRGLNSEIAGRCGAWCGARAVEQVGENEGYPLLAELPDDLRAAFAASTEAMERNELRG